MPEAVALEDAVKPMPHRAVEYFRSKGYKISWDWNEVLGEAHNKAFTVAKAAKLDVLRSIREELDKAIADGLTEHQFIKNLEPRLRKLGWWGKKEVDLPGGGKQVVQLGSIRRLKTIYRTNMMSAYNAGRYKQMKDNAADRPYWQYVAVIDSRTRHAHRELHGKVFRYDDLFWDTFYPPNGWNCRCRVRALSAGEVANKGLRVENSKVDLSKFKQTIVNKSTGEAIEIDATRYRGKDIAGKPFTIVPDASFGYNPGKGWARWDTRGNIAEGLGILKPDQKSFADYGAPSMKLAPSSFFAAMPPLLPKANSPTAETKQLKEFFSAATKNGRIETPVGTVIVDGKGLEYVGQKAGRSQHARAILETIENPDEVWLSEYKDGGWRRRFIKFYISADKERRGLVAIARDNADGTLFWNSFVSKPNYGDGQRTGVMLYQRLRL